MEHNGGGQSAVVHQTLSWDRRLLSHYHSSAWPAFSALVLLSAGQTLCRFHQF